MYDILRTFSNAIVSTGGFLALTDLLILDSLVLDNDFLCSLLKIADISKYPFKFGMPREFTTFVITVFSLRKQDIETTFFQSSYPNLLVLRIFLCL